MKKFYGTGVALVTPFTKMGSIDYTSFKKLLIHTAKGVDYYVVMGTTGESGTVTTREKQEALSFVRGNNPKKLPIVFGIGGNNTAAVKESFDNFSLEGVDAILSVSPYYSKPSQAGIIRHFEVIADRSPLPVILYNVPGRTGANMTAETTLKLARHPNIIGTKEASGNLEQCIKIAKGKPDDFLLISGDDLFTLPMLNVGAVGVISVLANAFPLIFKNLVWSFLKGNTKKSMEEIHRLVGIHCYMYEEGNPSGIKEVLQELAICNNYVRLPMVTVSAALRQKIRTAMKDL